MLTRPDVKGALAHSTDGPDGLHARAGRARRRRRAIVHLVGHAMYKAALFLGSGSAIGGRQRKLAAHARSRAARGHAGGRRASCSPAAP
jgi:NADH-quinone oxidoreductase subunit L/NAD(P)H-quinone oxidoreductase subunit 5